MLTNFVQKRQLDERADHCKDTERIAVCGSEKSSSPVAEHFLLKPILCLFIQRLWTSSYLDFEKEVPNSLLSRAVYQEFPKQILPDTEAHGHVKKLNRSLYRLEDAAEAKYNALFANSGALSLKEMQTTLCRMTKERVLVMCYVDDLLLSKTSDLLINQAREKPNKSVQFKDLRKTMRLLGIELTRKAGGSLPLKRSEFLNQLLGDTGINKGKSISPWIDHSILVNDNSPIPFGKFQHAMYCTENGHIMYLANTVKPGLELLQACSRLNLMQQ